MTSTKEIIEEFDKKFGSWEDDPPEVFDDYQYDIGYAEFYSDVKFFLSKALTSQREEFRKMVEEKIKEIEVTYTDEKGNSLDIHKVEFVEPLQDLLKELE